MGEESEEGGGEEEAVIHMIVRKSWNELYEIMHEIAQAHAIFQDPNV